MYMCNAWNVHPCTLKKQHNQYDYPPKIKGKEYSLGWSLQPYQNCWPHPILHIKEKSSVKGYWNNTTLVCWGNTDIGHPLVTHILRMSATSKSAQPEHIK